MEAVKSGVLTPNEARELLGYDKKEGADVLLAPANLLPLTLGMKNENPGDSLRFLRLFLGRHEPIVMDEALKLWNRQREAITRTQIEYAVANKEVPVEWMLAWQDDYADFVNNTLDPEWREAFRDAGEKMAEEGITPAVGEPFFFTPTGRRIDEWIQTRGGELITNLTVQQREAVRAIIRHYTVEAPSSPDELARVLRPVIGLTKRQALCSKLEEY